MSFEASTTQLELLLERIDSRLPGRESHELEFKTSANKLPDSLWETISAFANTGGGRIILGIDERESPPAISGVSNADRLLQQFHDQVRNPQKISLAVCGPMDAFIEPEGDKQLIVIQVPPAPRTSRPVFINGNPYTGTYVRGHAGDHRCQRDEVDRMIRESHSEPPDAVILPGYSIDDLDLDAVRRYRRRFALLNEDSPWNALEDREFLRNIGGWKRDRLHDEEGLTVAGLLMFGNRLALRDWRGRHQIDFRLLPELARAAEWEDHLLIESGIFSAYEIIAPRLTISLKTPLRFEGGVRIDDTPAHRAVREALVNLLIHADYAEPAPSQVFSAPDGFQFLNPGNSRVPYEELTFGRRTDPRNPTLALMFRMINLAEEAGSGILRIFTAWRDLGFRQPTINVGADRYEFLLEMRHAHLIEDDDRAWLQAVDPGLSEAEQLALLAARHEGSVDNARLRAATGLHRFDATTALRRLKERNLLTMTGWARGAFYQLGPAALAVPYSTRGERGALGDPGRLGEPSGPGTQSFPPDDPNVTTSDLSLSTTAANLTTSDPSLSTNAANLTTSDSSLSPNTQEQGQRDTQEVLRGIAEIARSQQRLSPRVTEQAILELCTVQPLTLRELTILLGRSRQVLMLRIRALETAGALRPLHPQRNHPYQRYVAVVPAP